MRLLAVVAILVPLGTRPAAAVPTDVSTAEFLKHCDLAPEPCKALIIRYINYLVNSDSQDACILHLNAAKVMDKIIGYMKSHPELSSRDWIGSLDDTLAALKLCSGKAP